MVFVNKGLQMGSSSLRCGMGFNWDSSNGGNVHHPNDIAAVFPAAACIY